MTTSVTFETATIADTIKKAGQVAPSKGSAFDKAAGIVLDITPDDPVKCVVRATNLDIFFIEAVDVVQAVGEPVRWRLPSTVLAHVVGTLPAANNEITFADQTESTRIMMTSKKLRAQIARIDSSYYQDFDVADIDYSDVDGVGGRINQVAWAAAKGSDIPFNGIHFTGTHIVATDRYRVARVPLLAPLARPVTVPAGVLGTILRQTGEIQIGLDDTLMYFRPDEYTQISTVLLEQAYPPIDKIITTGYEHFVKLRKQELIDMVNRSLGFAGADRAPLLRVFIGKEQIAPFLANEEVGHIGDVLEVPGQCDHERIEICFTPKNLIDALSNAPNDTVSIGYNTSVWTKVLYVDGGSGYEAWVVPRKNLVNNG